MSRSEIERNIGSYLPPELKRYESLLLEFIASEHADKKYCSEIATKDSVKILSCVWEAILWKFLSAHSFNLSPHQDAGPDFCVNHSGQKIWIEAVAPDLKKKKEDESFESGIVNTDQYTLAWTGAIKEKRERFVEYVCKNIVGEKDICIIAISTLKGEFSSYRPIPGEIPYPIQVTLGLGDLHMMNGKKKYPKREYIAKPSGNFCASNIFFTEEYMRISAILCFDNREGEWSLIHNPRAENQLKIGFFNLQQEWSCNIK